MRNCMIKNVRVAAQLGDPPQKFYTNVSESMNNMLKLKTDRKMHSLTEFVSHVYDLVSIYEKNMERAFDRRGDWRLTNQLIPVAEKRHASILKQIKEASCMLSSMVTTDQHAMPTKTAGTNPDSNEASCSSSAHLNDQNLSLSYTVLIESGCVIHEDTLRGIWEKAARLVADSTLIVPVPGTSNSNATLHRMVASSTNECPHLVTTPSKFTGQFKCDSKCVMFSTYKVCSHTIATAEVTGKLQQFIQWLVKQKCSPNYNNLAMHGIPKGAGEKGGTPKPTQKRKQGASGKAKTCVDRLSMFPSNTEYHMEENSSICGEFIMPAASVASVHNTWIGSNSTQYPQYTNPSMFHYPVPVPMPLYTNTWPTVSPPASNSVISPYPFMLKVLTTRIRICQSCRITFDDSREPPYDLVVSRKECRPYKSQGGQFKSPSAASNSHYHVNLHCIRAADPAFNPVALVIPDDVRTYLQDIHRGFLYATLGIHV